MLMIKVDKIESSGAAMNEYRFSKKLTDKQANYLMVLIEWRRGSGIVVRKKDDAVIGCIADEHDVLDFLSTYPKIKCERIGRSASTAS